MQTGSRHYAKLLKTQNLVRMHDQAALEMLRRDLAAIEDENRYLLALIENGSNADFIDATLLSRRLERNRRNESILQARINREVRALLQVSRRCDILKGKQHEVQDQEERKELADVLAEYVAGRCRDTPCGKSSFAPASLKFKRL